MRRFAAATVAASVAALGPAVFPAGANADEDDGRGEIEAKLVRTTHTSKFDPPSPDPSGITNVANRSRLLISDSEVDEMSSYEGVNLFFTTRAGKKTWGRSTERYSAEPTGIAYNPRNGHLFVSDDQADEIYEIAPGSDGHYGTKDDVVTSFSTRKAGNKDPEDVAFDTDRGHLLVVDGSEARVYRYQPGDNGRFDGIKGGDDKVSHFDVDEVGAKDPEGIAYDSARNSMLVLDHKSQKIYELSSSGTLLNTISISAARPAVPAGLTLAPASDGSGRRNVYIVDRGVDNDRDPQENDGRLYEMSVSLPPRN